MEIQNISGSDIMTSKLSVNTNITGENTKPEKQPEPANEQNTEGSKGRLIDTKA
jgi:hypothetical protein